MLHYLVCPILGSGCCVWDPSLSSQINKLEKKLIKEQPVLRYRKPHHGSRYHQNQYEQFGLVPLQERRAKLKVTLLFKIINDLSIVVDKTDLILTNSPRCPFCFFVPCSEKDVHLHSFFPSTIRLWNSLPLITKNSPTLYSFKEAVNQSTITTY